MLGNGGIKELTDWDLKIEEDIEVSTSDNDISTSGKNRCLSNTIADKKPSNLKSVKRVVAQDELFSSSSNVNDITKPEGQYFENVKTVEFEKDEKHLSNEQTLGDNPDVSELSFAKVILIVVDMRSDFEFEVRLISSAVVPIPDIISDITLAINWLSEGHIKWTSVLLGAIFLSSFASIVGQWMIKLDEQILLCRCMHWPSYLLGCGPFMAVPNPVRHRGKRRENYYHCFFIFMKIIEVVCEANCTILFT